MSAQGMSQKDGRIRIITRHAEIGDLLSIDPNSEIGEPLFYVCDENGHTKRCPVCFSGQAICELENIPTRIAKEYHLDTNELVSLKGSNISFLDHCAVPDMSLADKLKTCRLLVLEPAERQAKLAF